MFDFAWWIFACPWAPSLRVEAFSGRAITAELPTIFGVALMFFINHPGRFGQEFS
jgi:hypothetical protein